MIGKNRTTAVIWSGSSDEDSMLNLSSKTMLEAPTPNDDIWRKFALPLTPPSSPRSYGESSDNDEVFSGSCEIAERLHDVCERLDSTLDESTDVFRDDVMALRSKLISDCMWSGNTTSTRFLLMNSNVTESDKKLSESDIDLYPTPCPSPPRTTSECPTSNDCVDPTTVFPSCSLSDVPSSGVSDSDEEIDVVTVDVKPVFVAGSKRKSKSQNIVVHAKVQHSNSSSLRRTRSSPAKFHISCSTTEEEHGKKRKLVSVTAIEDHTPNSENEDRRASHNVLERKRRIDLKNNFERLRDIIPSSNIQKEKAPKVVVLKQAAMLIKELTTEQEELLEEKQKLAEINLSLQHKLQSFNDDVNEVIVH